MSEQELKPESKEKSGFTLRAFLIGLFFVLFIAVIVPYNIIYVGSSELGTRAFPMGAAIAFLLCVFIGNLLLKKFIPAAVLKAREILVIYVIVLIACVFPGIGLMMYMGTIAGPAEYGTANNKYFETLFKGVDRVYIRDEIENDIRPMLKEELIALKAAFEDGGNQSAFKREYYHVPEGIEADKGAALKPGESDSYEQFIGQFSHAPWDHIVPFNSVEARSVEGPTNELDYMFKGFPPRYDGPHQRP